MLAQEAQPTSEMVNGIEILQLRPNFYMLAGAGGNIAVQTGRDGAVVVDSGSVDKSDAVLAAIRTLTDQPIRFIFNTSGDADHVGGNEKLSKAGQTIFQINALGNAMNRSPANVVAAENVLMRMSAAGGGAAFPAAAWPTETFNNNRMYMRFNGEGIELLHQPAAHTDGDSFVFFRRSDVVAAGDVLDTTRFPVIDVEKGGSIQGEIDALNRLVELSIPAFPLFWEGGSTYVIPGHGRVYDQFDVIEYRDMITIIRDRIQDMIQRGMTLEQIQAASPTQGYTREYGSDSGPWTTNMFVEAVYKSLTQEK